MQGDYQVECILDKRFVRGHPEYLVKWVGYSLNQCTWEGTKNLKNVITLIIDYENQQVVKKEEEIARRRETEGEYDEQEERRRRRERRKSQKNPEIIHLESEDDFNHHNNQAEKTTKTNKKGKGEKDKNTDRGEKKHYQMNSTSQQVAASLWRNDLPYKQKHEESDDQETEEILALIVQTEKDNQTKQILEKQAQGEHDPVKSKESEDMEEGKLRDCFVEKEEEQGEETINLPKLDSKRDTHQKERKERKELNSKKREDRREKERREEGQKQIKRKEQEKLQLERKQQEKKEQAKRQQEKRQQEKRQQERRQQEKKQREKIQQEKRLEEKKLEEKRAQEEKELARVARVEELKATLGLESLRADLNITEDMEKFSERFKQITERLKGQIAQERKPSLKKKEKRTQKSQPKDAKEAKEAKQAKVAKEAKVAKDAKEAKEEKEAKQTKEEKGTNENEGEKAQERKKSEKRKEKALQSKRTKNKKSERHSCEGQEGKSRLIPHHHQAQDKYRKIEDDRGEARVVRIRQMQYSLTNIPEFAVEFSDGQVRLMNTLALMAGHHEDYVSYLRERVRLPLAL